MKTEEKTDVLVKVPESELLSLASVKLKGRVLFPQRIEDAKKYLKNIKVTAL
ncbi:hypothetical protein GO495_30745 [Chitinophaga oryziterrae]|uniref:Uncharacterized protein n=1 Tax=Chitinophaga oryziterrae TaxID=1031224 RepID=A0A6N8JKV1_9BACT|nr:hypothetical protein [Chitinophaga oryziterrae]MVT45006.1 hypothetical protein [Chitinophaga oryziterrae]